MKEDVKNIEELLKEAKYTGIYDNNKYLYSVEKLLKRYKDLEEDLENVIKVVNKYGGEQLRKYLMELSRFLGNVSIDAMLGTIKREFIPISTIQNILDELDKKIPIAQGEELIIFEAKEDILQELLKRKE